MLDESPRVSTLRQFRKLLPFLAKAPVALGVGFLSLVLLVVVSRWIPQLLGQLVDRVFINKEFGSLKQACLLYAGLEIASLILNFTKTYYFQIFAHRMLFHLRRELMDHVHRLPLNYFNKSSSGRITHRLTQDMLNLVNFYSDTGITLITHAFSVLGIVIAMFLISVKMTLIIILLLPLFLIASFFLTKRMQKAQREQKQKLSSINGFLAEKTMGMKIIHLYNQTPLVQKQFKFLSDDYKKTSVDLIHHTAMLQPIFNLMAGTNVTLAMGLGAWFVYQNELAAGACIAFILHVQDMIHPLRDSVEKYQELQNSLTSGERVIGLLDEPQESSTTQSPTSFQSVADTSSSVRNQNSPKNPLPITKLDQEFRQPNLLSSLNPSPLRENKNNEEEVFFQPPFKGPVISKSKFPTLTGEIEVRDLHFRYSEKDKWILRSVNLKAPAGTAIAMVGRTGSGKTTLASLIQRLYEVPAHSIFIDHRDITEIPLLELRSQVGLVQQDAFLFRGSILENVRLFNAEISMEQVQWALTQIGLSAILERTGRDVHWNIQEHGANLSMGERQLVAFARILAFNPPLVILDEATANLDLETEQLIQAATKTILKGRTSLIIAHRLSTVEHCDIRWNFFGDGVVTQS